MKNRAQGLAALLNNFDEAKQALEDAYNAEGSALKENDRYMESIAGHTAILQNRLQELAAVTINSDWLKDIVDLGSGAIKVVTKLVDTIGSGNIAAGVLMGAIGTASKIGPINYSKGNGFSIGNPFATKSATITVQQGFDRGEALYGAINDKDQSLLQMYNIAQDGQKARDVIESQWGDLGTFFGGLSEDAQERIKPLWKSVENGSMEAKTFVEKAAYSVGITMNNTQKAAAINMDKIKGFAMSTVSAIGNAVISMGISMLISAGASLIMNALDEIINHADKVLERGEEAKKKIEDIYKSVTDGQKNIKDIAISVNVDNAKLNTTKQNLEGIAETYADMKKGVDDVTNANKTLSTEKYEKYLQLSKDLADQFPNLVEGYDSQGTAILELSGNVETCTQQLQDMYDVSLDIANLEITNSLDKSFEAILQKAKDTNKELVGLKAEGDTLDESLASAKEGYRMRGEENLAYGTSLRFQNGEVYDQWQAMFKDYIKKTDRNQETKFMDSIQTQADSIFFRGLDDKPFYIQIPQEDFYQDPNTIQAMLDSLDKALEITGDAVIGELEHESSDINTKIRGKEGELAQLNRDTMELITNSLTTNSDFMSNNETLVQAVLSNLSKFDVSSIGDEDLTAFIYDNILQYFEKIPREIQDGLAEIMNGDYSDLKFTKYENTLKDMITGLFDTEELQEEMKKEFNIDDISILVDDLMDLTSLDNSLDKLEEKKSNIVKKLGHLGFKYEDMKDYTIGQIIKGSDLVNSRAEKNKPYLSIQGFNNDLDRETAPFENDGLFSDVLNDETYKAKAESLEKNITAISNAIASALENGGVAIGDARTALQDVMADTFKTFSTDELNAEGLKQIQKWMNLLTKTGSDKLLGADGLESLKSYAQNRIMSQENIKVSADEFMTMYNKSIKDAAMKNGGGTYVTADALSEEFMNELQDEDKRKLLYTLYVTMDTTEWDIEKWREEFDNITLDWKLKFNIDDFTKNTNLLDETMNRLQGDVSYQDQVIANNKKNGKYDSTAQINQKISDTNELISLKREKAASYYDKNNVNSIAYKVSNGQLEYGSEEYRQAMEQMKKDLQGLEGEIETLEANIVAYTEERMLVPVNIIDGTLNELKGQYDQFVAELGAYGENIPKDSELLDNTIQSIQDQLTNENLKVEIFDDILSQDNLTQEFRDTITALKTTATNEINTLNTDLSKYVEDSEIGEDQIAIVQLKSQKAMQEAAATLLGRELTKEDYEGFNETEEALKEHYNNIIRIAAQKKQEIKDANNGTLEGLDVEAKNNWEYWDKIWSDAVLESTESLTTIENNNKNIELLPLSELESQLAELEESGETLEATIKSIEETGDRLPTDEEYGAVVKSLNNRAQLNSQLALRYEGLAKTARTKSDREDYEKKAGSFARNATTLRGNARGYMDKMDKRSIEFLEIDFDRINTGLDDLEKGFENAKRPLTDGDYKQALDLISDGLTNAGEQQEYWNAQLDKYADDKYSKNYTDAEKSLLAILNVTEMLTASQEKYNKLLAEQPFVDVNKDISNTQRDLENFDLEVNLKLAKGGIKTDDDFAEEQKKYQDLVNENQAGMDSAMEEMKKQAGIPSPIEFLRVSPKEREKLAKKMKNVDLNFIKELSDKYDAYYKGRLQAETNLANSIKEQNDSELITTENHIARMTEEIEKYDKIISDSSHLATMDDYNNAYTAVGEKIKDLNVEAQHYQDLMDSMKYNEDGSINENFDENNQQYQYYISQLQSANNEITELTEKQKQYKKAMENLGIDKISREIENYNKKLKDLKDTQDLNAAKGIDKTLDDYKMEDKYYEDIKKDSEQAAKDLQDKFNFMIHWQIMDPDSADAKQMKDQIQGFLDQALNADINLANNAHAEEIFPITELQKDLDELELAGNEIQRTFEDIKRSGDDVEDYSDYTDNLESRRTILENIKGLYEELYSKHSGDSFGAEILKNIDSVNAKLQAIDQEKFDIDFEIDHKKLTDLQEDMGYLEREAANLQNALSNPENTTMSKEDVLTAIIKNSQQSLTNLKGQADEYQRIMTEIQEENPDDFLNNNRYIEAATGLANIDSQIANINSTLKDTNKQLSQLPIEKLEKALKYNEANKNYEDAARSYKEATGHVLSQDDYTRSINLARADVLTNEGILGEKQANVELKRATLEFAQKNPTLKNVELAQEEYETAVLEATTAQIAVLESQTEVSDTQRKALEAEQNVYQQRVGLLKVYSDNLKAERELAEAQGHIRTRDEIATDRSISLENKKDLEEQRDALNANHSGLTPLEYATQRLALTQAIYDEEMNIYNLQGELAEQPIKATEKALENLKQSHREIKAMSDSFSNMGKEIPTDILQQGLENIQAQKFQAGVTRDYYKGLVDFWKPVLGESSMLVKGWQEKYLDANEEYINLEGEEYNTQKAIDEKPFEHLSNALERVKREHKEFTDMMDKGVIPKSAENYRIAIEGATEEQQYLIEQIKLTKLAQKDYNINDPEYQTLQSTLNSLTDEYNALTDSINNWGDAIKNLPLDSAIKNLEEFREQMGFKNDDLNNKVNHGYRMTADDYSKRISDNEYLASEARRLSQMYAKDTDQLERVGLRGSQEYKDAYENYEKYKSMAADLDEEIAVDKDNLRLLPIDELKREQAEIQQSFNAIGDTIEELETKGQEAGTDLLIDQMDLIDKEVLNLEDQRDEYEKDLNYALENNLQDAADNARENIAQVDSDISKLTNKKYNITITIRKKVIDKINNDLKLISNNANELNTKLNTLTTTSAGRESIIESLIENEKANRRSQKEAIQYHQNNLARITRDTNGQANYYNNSEYRASVDAMNELEIGLINTTDKINELSRALNHLPLDRLQKQLQDLARTRGIVESQDEIKKLLGGRDNYVQLLNIDIESSDVADQAVKDAKEIMDNAYAETQKYNRNSPIVSVHDLIEQADKDYEIAKQDYEEALQNANKAEATELQSKMNLAYEPVQQLQDGLKDLDNQANSVLNEINRLSERGETGTLEQYERLIQFDNARINNLERTKDELTTYRNTLVNLMEEYGISEYANVILQPIDEQMNELDEMIAEYFNNNVQYDLMKHGGIELVGLERVKARLEREATSIQDAIGLAENTGRTPSIGLYQSAIDNNDQQANNLRKRIELLKEQNTVQGISIDEYNKNLDQISQFSSELATIESNSYQFKQKIVAYARNLATALSSTISTAISESFNNTGVSASSIESLREQFSTLEEVFNVNTSTLFYETAEGVKLNSKALSDLIAIQKRSYGNDILKKIHDEETQINSLTTALKENKDIQDDADTQNLKTHKRRLDDLKQELSGYQAILDALEEANSLYAQWQNAQSSANKGDKYDAIYENLSNLEQHLDDGTFKDEDSTFIKMLSRYGIGTPEEFERITPQLQRYFMQGMDGLQNFVDDLVENGFATMQDGVYSIKDLDISKVAKAFGLSEEAIQYIFDKLSETTGAEFLQPKDGIDAFLKAQEKQKEYIDAWKALQQAQKEGNAEQVDYLEGKLGTLASQIVDLKNYDGGQLISQEAFDNAKEEILHLQNMARSGFLDDATVEDEIQGIAQRAGIVMSKDGRILTNTLEQANENLMKSLPDLLNEEEVPMKVTLSDESLTSLSELDMGLNKDYLTDQVQDAFDQTAFKLNVDVATIEKADHSNIRGKTTLSADYYKDNDNRVEVFKELLQSFASKKYGNIDLNNRQSMPMDDGSIATVLGSWDNNFVADGGNISVAFSPLLQTENGPVLLKSGIMNDYIQLLLDNAYDKNGFNPDLVFNLDKQGFLYRQVEDAFGKIWDELNIKNMVAGVSKDTNIDAQNAAGIIGDIMHESEEGTYDNISYAVQRILDTLNGNESLMFTLPIRTNDVEFINMIQKALDEHGAFPIKVYPVIPSSTASSAPTFSNAFAEGTNNGEITHKTTALVNELGHEGVIHNGVLREIHGGMHEENLSPGDVVLNAQQMDQLKKTGRASGKGRVIGGAKALYEKNAYAGGLSGTFSIPSSGLTGSSADWSHYIFRDEKNRGLDTVIDNIPRYLNQLNRTIQRLDSSISEYTSASEKREILEEKYTAIMKQIAANNKAYTEYMAKANEIANQTEFIDSSGKKKTIESLASRYNLEDLRNGKLSLDTLSNNEKDKQYYEMAQKYLEWVDKGQSAQDETFSLQSTLQDIYESLIGLPFEELEKSLDKLSSKISANSAFTSAAQSGEAGARLLSNTLSQYFGEEGASLFDATGNSYEVLNRLLQKNVELKKEELTQNIDALNLAKEEYDNLLNEQSSLHGELATAKETIINTLQLTEEDYERILNNKAIEASHFDQYEGAEDVLNDYNLLIAKVNSCDTSVKKLGDDIEKRTYENYAKAAETSQEVINMIDSELSAIDKYYSAIQNHTSTLNDGLAASADYITKWLRVSDNTMNLINNYTQQIANYAQEADVLSQNIAAQEAYLNSMLANGTLKVTDTEYLERINQINSMKNTLKDYINGQNEATKAMMDLPNEVVTEKLADIEAAYNSLTTAMNKNIASSLSTIRAYERIAGSSMFTTTGNPLEYQYQNALSEAEVQKLQQEAQVTIDGYNQALANYLAGGTPEEMKMKTEALRTAQTAMDDKVMEAAVKAVQLYSTEMSNIENYYKTINSYIDTEINKLDIRNASLDRGVGYVRNSYELMGNYRQIMSKTAEQIDNINLALAAMKEVLAQGLANGRIQVGDQEYIRLTTQITELENQGKSLGNTMLDTWDKMLEIPDKKLQERLKKIANSFKWFSAIMDNNISNLDERKIFAGFMQELDNEFGDMGQIEIDLSAESYVQGDKNYQSQIDKESQNVEQQKKQLYDLQALREETLADVNHTQEQIDEIDDRINDTENNIINTYGKIASLRANQASDSANRFSEFIDSQSAPINADLKKRQTVRSLETDRFGYTNPQHLFGYSGYIQNEIKDYDTLISFAQKKADGLRQRYRDGILKQGLSEDSEQMKALKAQLLEADAEVVQLQQDSYNLFKEQLAQPKNYFDEQIANYQRKHSLNNTLLQNGIYDSVAGYNMFASRTDRITLADDSRNEESFRFPRKNQLLYQEAVDASEQAKMASDYAEQQRAIYEQIASDSTSDVDKIQKAEYAMIEAYNTADEMAATAASKFISNFNGMLSNVNSYFDSLNSNLDSTASKLDSMNQYLEATSTIYKTKFKDMIVNTIETIGNTSEQYVNSLQNAADLKAYLDKAMKEGYINKGDTNWIQATTMINNLEAGAERLRVNTIESYKSLLEFPEKEFQNKLQLIQNKFASLNAVLNNNITASDTARNTFRELIQRTSGISGIDKSTVAGMEGSQPTFIYQNAAIAENMKQQKEMLEARLTQVNELKKVYDSVRTNVKAGIDERNLAKQAYETAQTEYANDAAKWANDRTEAIKNMVINVKAYYDKEIGFINSLNSKLEANRNLMVEFGKYTKNSRKIIATYSAEIKNTVDEYNNLEAAIVVMRQQIEKEHKDNNLIGNDYEEMKQQLTELQTQLVNTKQKQIELFRDMIKVPSGVVDEKVEDITRKYYMFTNALDSGMLSSSAGRNIYNFYTDILNDILGLEKIEIDDQLMSENLSDSVNEAISNINIKEEILDPDNLMEEKITIEDIFDEELFDGTLVNDLTEEIEEAYRGIHFPTTSDNLKPDLIPEYVVSDEKQIYPVREINTEYKKQNDLLLDQYRRSNEIFKARTQEAIAAKQIYEQIKDNKDIDEEYKEVALQNVYETTQKAEDAAFELGKLRYSIIDDLIENTSKYFSIIDSYYNNVSSNMQSIRQFAADIYGFQAQGSLIGRNLEHELDYSTARMDTIRSEIIKIQEIVKAGVESGDIEENSLKYAEYMNTLEEKRGQYISMASTKANQLKEYFSIANNEATEQINKYAQAYRGLEAVMSNMSTTGQQRALAGMGYDYSFRNQDITNWKDTAYAFGETYVGQNLALERSLERSKKELDTYHEAVLTTYADLQKARNDESLGQDAEIMAMQAHNTALDSYYKKLGQTASEEINDLKNMIGNVATYYSGFISFYDSVSDKAESTRKTIEKFNSTVNDQGVVTRDVNGIIDTYRTQIEQNKLSQQALSRSIVEQTKYLDIIKDKYGEDTEEYREGVISLNQLQNQYDSLTIKTDEFYDAMRQEIDFTPIDNAIARLKQLNTSFSNLKELILDNAKITKEGAFTDLGKLFLNMDLASYNNAIKNMDELKKKQAKMIADFRTDEFYTEEEFSADMNKVQGEIQDVAKSMLSNIQSIIKALEDRRNAEVSYEKELIDAYEKELSKKKEMSDFDKTLKEKNNSVKQVEMQIRALERLLKRAFYINCGNIPITLVCYNVTGNGKRECGICSQHQIP